MTMTPYAAAKIVNAQLKELNIDKTLPPQMLYTYANKGYIKSTRDTDNKIRINQDDLAEWFTGYVNKNFKKTNINTETNIDKDQLSLDI